MSARADRGSNLFYSLHDLLELHNAIREVLSDMDYRAADGSRNTDLDRVAALGRIAGTTVAHLIDVAAPFDNPSWMAENDECTNVSEGLAVAITKWQTAEDRFRSEITLDPANDHDAISKAKDAAELAMITEPCLSLDDVRAKARVALHDESVFDSITNCTLADGHVGIIFLRSLLGEEPARPVDCGGK